MRTAREIYDEYNIMPSLQLHQLRVAAVGKLVCEHFTQPVNKNDVVLACLFHDMGNIIKSDLALFPDFTEPEGLGYWQKVKEDFVRRYGKNVKVAISAIAREIGLPAAAISLIEGVGFSKLKDIQSEDSFERKIVEYGDCRVAPNGVVSIEERFLESRKRYAFRYPSMEETDVFYDAFTRAGMEIEKQIFAQAMIVPGDVNDTSVAPLIEELREYPIS
jgi:hypothetical protein